MEPVFERYVSREMGVLMKEKGFDQHGGICYDDKENVQFFFYPDYCKHEDWYIYCPTLSLAMRWLREQYKIDITTFHEFVNGEYWWSRIEKADGHCLLTEYEQDPGVYRTYEDSAEDAVKYCLEKLI